MEYSKNEISKDEIYEFISDNELSIPDIIEKDIIKNFRNDIRLILLNKETETEIAQFLDEILNATEKKIWDNYIGIYYDVNNSNLEKRLKNFTNRLEFGFILKDVPFGVKNMRLFEYDKKVWKEFLIKIVEGYSSTGYTYPPYKKILKEFFKLNQRAYVVRKAYLQKQVLNEYITEVNTGKSVVPEDYRKRWQLHEKQEKLKLLQVYKEYKKKSTVEKAIEKIFEDLKIKLNLLHLPDLEASDEIQLVTDITFYEKDVGFKYYSVSKIIRDYKRYK